MNGRPGTPLSSSRPSSYENKYFEELKVKAEEEKKSSQPQMSQTQQSTSSEQKDTKVQIKTSSSSNREHDLDVFLLGDLGSDDEGPVLADGGDEGLDDDFDKIDGTSGLESDDDEKKPSAGKSESAKE